VGLIETITNPFLNPLLVLSPFWIVVIVSFIVSLLVTVIYKLVTNQDEMKRLKTKLKEHQKRMKEEGKEHPEKLMQMQKEAMSVNMEYMKHSFKPTLVTFIPIILIFGWLGAHLAFVPIMPGADFTLQVGFEEGIEGVARVVAPQGIVISGERQQEISDDVMFSLTAVEEGEYFVDIEVDGKIYSKDVLVTTEQSYAEQIQTYDGAVQSITLNYEKLIIFPIGFRDWLGWLGMYILFSLVFSMGLRKLFKLY
jgi:uncharacterized membrane protein (DUF106 family)